MLPWKLGYSETAAAKAPAVTTADEVKSR